MSTAEEIAKLEARISAGERIQRDGPRVTKAAELLRLACDVLAGVETSETIRRAAEHMGLAADALTQWGV